MKNILFTLILMACFFTVMVHPPITSYSHFENTEKDSTMKVVNKLLEDYESNKDNRRCYKRDAGQSIEEWQCIQSCKRQ